MSSRINFKLEQILDPMRNDFKVLNPDYKNVVLFTTKKDATKIYSFNFLTLLYSEMITYEVNELDCNNKILETKTCYKIKKTVGWQIPEMFVVYHYTKEYKNDGTTRIVQTQRFYDFRPTSWNQ